MSRARQNNHFKEKSPKPEYSSFVQPLSDLQIVQLSYYPTLIFAPANIVYYQSLRQDAKEFARNWSEVLHEGNNFSLYSIIVFMPKAMTASLFFPLLSPSLFMPYAPFSPKPRGVLLAYETSLFSSRIPRPQKPSLT